MAFAERGKHDFQNSGSSCNLDQIRINDNEIKAIVTNLKFPLVT